MRGLALTASSGSQLSLEKEERANLFQTPSWDFVTGLFPNSVAVAVTVVVGLFFAAAVQGRTLHSAQT